MGGKSQFKKALGLRYIVLLCDPIRVGLFLGGLESLMGMGVSLGFFAVALFQDVVVHLKL